MSRFLGALRQMGWASGAVFYQDTYPPSDLQRIAFPLLLENDLRVLFLLDTGAPFSILDPSLAQRLPHTQGSRLSGLRIRGESFDGFLSRFNVTIPVDEGEPLSLESTFFVPSPPEEEPWPFPNFLGMSGFIDRLYLALDPFERALYIGKP